MKSLGVANLGLLLVFGATLNGLTGEGHGAAADEVSGLWKAAPGSDSLEQAAQSDRIISFPLSCLREQTNARRLRMRQVAF